MKIYKILLFEPQSAEQQSIWSFFKRFYVPKYRKWLWKNQKIKINRKFNTILMTEFHRSIGHKGRTVIRNNAATRQSMRINSKWQIFHFTQNINGLMCLSNIPIIMSYAAWASHTLFLLLWILEQVQHKKYCGKRGTFDDIAIWTE